MLIGQRPCGRMPELVQIMEGREIGRPPNSGKLQFSRKMSERNGRE